MGGRFHYTPAEVPEKDEDGNQDLAPLVDSMNKTTAKIKRSFDTLGMTFGYVVEVADSGASATKITVNHKLGVVPTDYIVTYQDKAGDVYDEGTTWTTQNIYLAASEANMKLRILCFVNTN